MTLPMDVRLASEKAKFGFVFARRGIVTEAASSWFLPRLVGIAQAMEAATGRIFDAQEASLAASSPACTRRTSCSPPPTRSPARSPTTPPPSPSPRSAASCGRACPPRPRGRAHRRLRLMASLGGGADAIEGVSSFLEKRDADFPLRVSKDLPPEVPDWPVR